MDTPETSTRVSGWKAFCQTNDISWPTYVLICIFGMGSWIAVNGLWVELPVLVRYVPEQWNLPSYLTVIFQLANIGPVIYALGNHFAPKKVQEKCAIFFVVTVGAVACALLAFFWDETSYIGGGKHSIVLFILSFCVAIVDCTSSVVFLTFMSIFPSFYMSALFVGETSSGLLPAFVALGQGINSKKVNCSANATEASSSNQTTKDNSGLRFSPEDFFFFLFAMMVACGLAFFALNYLPLARRQHVRVRHSSTTVEESDSVTRPLWDESSRSVIYSSSTRTSTHEDFYMKDTSSCRHRFSWCEPHILYLLCIQGWINCLSNGVLPSIATYASEPYGDKTYHLVATLSNIASALTCFVALWLPCLSTKVVFILSSIFTILSSYVVALASMSPTPPLHGTALGSFIIIAVSVVSSILLSYVKLMISMIMRDHGKQALFWCGISIQTGSCIGALVMFPLVNILKLFHQPNSC